jgi:nitrate/TMAO reductase-like tetraheme cytochrome c subunit
MKRQTRRWIFDLTVWIVGIATGAALVAEATVGAGKFSASTNDAWRTECGSCHVAYPPQLLSAQSWRTIMNGLDRHFGADASVDAGAAASIGAFLDANAARPHGKRSDPAALRITETRWFRHEHADIAAATWNGTKVGSAANCGACHGGADRGDFSERSVSVPR